MATIFSNTTTSHATPRKLLLGIFLSLSVAALGGVASPAYAEDSDAGADSSAAHDGGAREHHHAKDPAQLIQRFDKNRDGKLAVTELPERLQQRLGAADTNADGYLSVEELKAHAVAHAKARFDHLDKDHDGFLTPSELGDKRWARLKAADANADDKLTFDELRAARAAGKLKAPHHTRSAA